MYIVYSTIQFFFEINIFIHYRCIKLIKTDSKYIYNVKKKKNQFQIDAVLLNLILI